MFCNIYNKIIKLYLLTQYFKMTEFLQKILSLTGYLFQKQKYKKLLIDPICNIYYIICHTLNLVPLGSI